MLAVIDTQSGESATVALADVAADMSRYVLSDDTGDSSVITAGPAGDGSR